MGRRALKPSAIGAKLRSTRGGNVYGSRFSVVITCFNQRDFIQSAVDSALSQNPELLHEVIVLDDASTDGSQKILECYGSSIRFHSLKVNCGAIDARNTGASLAKAEYLVFLDGDDLLKPWALDVYERVVEEAHPAVILGQATWFSGSTPVNKLPGAPDHLQYVSYSRMIERDRSIGMSASTFVVQSKAFQEAGGWTHGIFQLDLQDISFKLNAVSMAYVLSPEVAFYRVHHSNSIHSVGPFLINLERIAVKERAGEYPGGSKEWLFRKSWVGGLSYFWVKRAWRAGFYGKAIRLATSKSLLILVAVLMRLRAVFRGRQKVHTLEISSRCDLLKAQPLPHGKG
jgi:glycosyltransferase involved in cell wall biosynthesis